MARELTPKQQRFIAAYQRGVTGVQAAIEAGYSVRSAKHAAHQLLHDNKQVRDELERVRQHLAQTAEYNGERCMSDADRGMEFALRTDNANAFVRAVELKARLTGLLRDKLDVTVQQKVDIDAALAAARARVLRPMCDLPAPIEGEFQALPYAAASRPSDY